MIENDDEDDLVAQSKNTISIALYQPLNKEREIVVLRDERESGVNLRKDMI